MAITLLAGLANITGLSRSYFNKSHSQIGEVFIDCTHAETIEYSNTITDHPVENGYSISDHIYRAPLRVKVEGSITDTPLDFIGTARTVAGLFDGGNLLNNIKETYLGKGRKQVTAYEMLTDLYRTGTMVTLVNYWDTFENMVIENITFPRDSQTGGRLYFEATLKQITLAKVETVTISTRTRDTLNSKTKLGSQATKDVPAEQATKIPSSVLLQAARTARDSVKSLIGN